MDSPLASSTFRLIGLVIVGLMAAAVAQADAASPVGIDDHASPYASALTDAESEQTTPEILPVDATSSCPCPFDASTPTRPPG